MPENAKGDYITLRLPDFSSIIGYSQGNDDTMHLASVFRRITACGKPMIDEGDGSLALTRELVINCPDCIAEINHRKAHPEAARKQFGIVTHQ